MNRAELAARLENDIKSIDAQIRKLETSSLDFEHSTRVIKNKLIEKHALMRISHLVQELK